MKKLTRAIVMLMLSACITSLSAALPTDGMQPAPFENVTFEKPNKNDEIKYKAKKKFDRVIYVDAQSGSDQNSGSSPAEAIKTLDKLASMNLSAGVEVLLKGGQRHVGTIELFEFDNADSSKPTHIGSYGGSKALIDAKGYPAGVYIRNSSNVTVSDLKITANGGAEKYPYMYREQDQDYRGNRCGVLIASTGASQNLLENTLIYNIDIDDVYLQNPSEVWRTCNRWGIRGQEGYGLGVQGYVVDGGAGVSKITLREVLVEDVGKEGVKFNGNGEDFGPIENNVDQLLITNCTVYQTGGPGMQFGRCTNSKMEHCRTTESGNRNDNRKWGRGSGMWTYSCTNFIFEYNVFEGAQGIGDSCGAHIDQFCKDVIIQYCFSRFNCGGFVEILGRCENCGYRYNVSINDGWRDSKDLPAQAFWNIGAPGIIARVDGYNSERRFVDTYSSYIYNNTIIVTEDGAAPYKNKFHFEIATSSKGVAVANNIFWFDSPLHADEGLHAWKDGKPYEAANDYRVSYAPADNAEVIEPKSGAVASKVRDMTEAEIAVMNVEMQNNIYKVQGKEALPERYWDENMLNDDPQFAKAKGVDIIDMIPQNAEAISQGIEVPILKTDKAGYGLIGGLKMKRDIFGNPIKGNIMGAIVPKAKSKSWNGGGDI